jgi:hypothetical protein
MILIPILNQKSKISNEIACILVQIFGDLTLEEAMTSVVWVLDLASNPHILMSIICDSLGKLNQ